MMDPAKNAKFVAHRLASDLDVSDSLMTTDLGDNTYLFSVHEKVNYVLYYYL